MKKNTQFVYQYKFFAKLVISLMMLPVIALMMLLNVILLHSVLTQYDQQGYLFFSLLGVSLCTLLWLVRKILHIYRFKFSLSGTHLNYRNLTGHHVVHVDEIIGYRTSFGNLIIETQHRHFKVPKNVSNFLQLKSVLANRFINLDQRDQDEKYNAFLIGERYGDSPQEREENLTRAKKHVKWCETVVTIFSVWLLIFPLPQLFLMGSLIMAMVWAFILVHRAKGLITFHFEQQPIFPSLFIVIFFIPLMLLVRYIAYADILRDQTYLMYTLGLTLMLSIWYLYLTQAHLKAKPKMILLVPFIVLCLGAFSVRTIDIVNVSQDTSVKTQYQTVVLEKYSNKNTKDVTRYYIGVKHWQEQQAPLKLQLNFSDHQKIIVGEPYILTIRKGNLNIPWIDTRTTSW